MVKTWSASTLSVCQTLPGKSGTCPIGEDGVTQASLAMLRVSSLPSTIPADSLHMEVIFVAGVKHDQVLHRDNTRGFLACSLHFLNVVTLILMCVCVST
jgi:hypothetical protein